MALYTRCERTSLQHVIQSRPDTTHGSVCHLCSQPSHGWKLLPEPDMSSANSLGMARTHLDGRAQLQTVDGAGTWFQVRRMARAVCVCVYMTGCS